MKIYFEHFFPFHFFCNLVVKIIDHTLSKNTNELSMKKIGYSTVREKNNNFFQNSVQKLKRKAIFLLEISCNFNN